MCRVARHRRGHLVTHLGAAATFSAFRPGIAADYTATVTSTAGDGTLTTADPSPTNTGHLVNGTFSLPNALTAMAGGPFALVGASTNPTTLRTYSGPVSNDVTTVLFRQTIGQDDTFRKPAPTPRH